MVLLEQPSLVKKTVVQHAKAKHLELERKLPREEILNKQTLIKPIMEYYVKFLNDNHMEEIELF